MTLPPDFDAADVQVRGAVLSHELNALRAAALGGPAEDVQWGLRLTRHSLTWVTSRLGDRLVGFVNVVGDGGAHAFLVDTVVDPEAQSQGIGTRLVAAAAAEAQRLGCTWLHADYEPRLADFYERICGLRPTSGGVLHLR